MAAQLHFRNNTEEERMDTYHVQMDTDSVYIDNQLLKKVSFLFSQLVQSSNLEHLSQMTDKISY